MARAWSHRARLALALAASVLAALAPAGRCAGETLHTLAVGGHTRSYLEHLPPAIASGRPVPLVVVLHGGGGNAWAVARQTGFDAEADRNGFIAVYPNGTGRRRLRPRAAAARSPYTWNAGTCCGHAAREQVDDVGFIRALIAEVARRHPVDRKRIYAAGMSNGGMMAYRLACAMSDTFAAVGVVAGVSTDPACRPAQPVSVIHFHGTADEHVPVSGGVGPKSLDRSPRPPLMHTIRFWVAHDRCPPAPRVTRSGNLTEQVYGPCAGNTQVVLYLIAGGGHSWPGGERLLAVLDEPSRDIAATPRLWQFFAAHPKP